MTTVPLSVLNRPLAGSGIPEVWHRLLEQYQIATIGQLYDRATGVPDAIDRLLETSGDEVKRCLEAILPEIAGSAGAIRDASPWGCAITGLAGPASEHPVLMQRRRENSEARNALRDRVVALHKQKALPSRVLHTPFLPGVQDQNIHGYCVGFGSTASRDYLAQTWMSPGAGYRLAKLLDGMPDVEGSFQAFAFEGFYRYGHIPEALYSYQDAINARPLEPLFDVAKRWRIAGYADLLPDGDFEIIPDLMRAVLAGRLVDDLGPRPLSTSLALYESFNSYTMQRTGLVTLPLPGEMRTGGHAMNVVGYLDARDPGGLFGTDWFVVRNSWGVRWAAENPLGLPGHALIPAAYFQNPSWLWELLFCIAEPSPHVMKGWIAKVMSTLLNVN